MELKKMTSKNLVFFDLEVTKKIDVINFLVDAFVKEGVVTNKNAFIKSVIKREKISPTGMEKGLAIPHGKSKAVKEAKFAVARLKKPINNWESVDPKNEVDLVFMLAIPESQSGNTHLSLLSELSKRLMSEPYIKSLKDTKTPTDFLNMLDVYGENPNNKQATLNKKTILAVTACAIGIAHTYMAADALQKAGEALGVNVIVEKQGATGIEDKHTTSLIKKADAVIFATDVAVQEMDRFNGLPYVKTNVQGGLKNAKKLIEKALQNPEGFVAEKTESSNTSDEKKSVFASMAQAVLTGMSYMIPIIVAAGLMIGIARLAAMPFGLADVIHERRFMYDQNHFLVILHHLNLFGGMIMRFMFPVFSAYTAFAIAGRLGIVSGLVGGLFANGMHFTLWQIDGQVPSGFFGAVILGLAAGYIAKFLNEKIKLPPTLQAVKPMLIIPSLSVLAIFLLNFYIVDPVFGGINQGLQNAIESAADAGNVLLSTIIAAATAFDLGGPVNRAAGTINIGLAADGIFPLTARVLAIVIPPIGVGLATVLDKYIVKRRVFDEDLRVAGSTSIILGLIAISEGAIPFVLKNPLITIPINIIGAVLGSVSAVLLGAVQWLPLPAIWGWPLVENILAYLFGLFVGVMFIALANIFIRYAIIKREETKILKANN